MRRSLGTGRPPWVGDKGAPALDKAVITEGPGGRPGVRVLDYDPSKTVGAWSRSPRVSEIWVCRNMVQMRGHVGT